MVTNKTGKEHGIPTDIGFEDNIFSAEDPLLGEQE
jgi:hypothetical protein